MDLSNMKTIPLLIITMLSALQTGAKTSGNLAWLFAQNESVEISKIENSFEATTISFITKKNIGQSFCIGHGIYIVGDDGERHHVIGAKGIKLDSLYVLTPAQRMKFSVSFTPVSKSNKAIDICEPEGFSVYGLHNSRQPLIIPKVKGVYAMEEMDYSLYKSGMVEIEGVLHGEKDVLCDTVRAFFSSVLLRNTPINDSGQYAKVSADGHFKMAFEIEAPCEIDFRCQKNPYVIGTIFVRPGDRIHIDLYKERKEGMALSYRNQSGRKAYNRLANAPFRFFDDSKFYFNLNHNFGDFSYEQHRDGLMNGWVIDLDFANYICWHYRLSPHEIQYYIDKINYHYVEYLIKMDNKAERNFAFAQSDEERKTYNKIVSKMDYAYLKRIDPNNRLALNTGRFGRSAMFYVSALNPIEECIDKVPSTDPDLWLKVIELQKEALNGITGWKGMTLVLECIIVATAQIIWSKNPDTTKHYNQVREMLTHPLSRASLDQMYREWSNIYPL